MAKVVDSAALEAWIAANEYEAEEGGTEPVPPEPAPDDVVPVGIDGDFDLVFRDEFDGSTLNDDNWTPNWLGPDGEITKPINSAECAAYDPRNVKVNNSNLELYAEKRAVTDNRGTRYEYASGCVTSGSKQEFIFGIFEAKLLLPTNSNRETVNWPAWWQNGHHDDWPDAGETDTMERLSSGVRAHYHANDFHKGSSAWSTDFTKWHTYSVEWARGLLVYRYDGIEQMRITGDTVLEDEQYLVLNHALSHEEGGPLLVPSTFKVDYVRVWERR
jgi:beta-glucanase (GH16 family)